MGNILQYLSVYLSIYNASGSHIFSSLKEDRVLEEKFQFLTDSSLDVGIAFFNFG